MSGKVILRVFLGHDDTSITTGNGCISLALVDGSAHAVDNLIGDSVVVEKGRIDVVRADDQEFDLLNAESGPNSSRASGVDVGYVAVSVNTGYVEARKEIFGATDSGPLEFLGKILSASGHLGASWLLSFDEKNHARVCEELADEDDCDLNSSAVAGIVENLIKGNKVTERDLMPILGKPGLRRCITVETAERLFKKVKENKWFATLGLVASMLGRAMTVVEQTEMIESAEDIDDLQAILSSISIAPEVQLICAKRLTEDFRTFPPELVRLICSEHLGTCSLLLEASPEIVCPVLKEALRRSGDEAVTAELGRSVHSVGLKDSYLATEVCGESCALFKLVLESAVSKLNEMPNGEDRSWDLLIAILTDCLPELSDKLISRPDISAIIASALSDLLEPLEALHDSRLRPCLTALMHLCHHQLRHWKAVSRACPLTEESRCSLPVALTEAGLVDLAILLLKSPHQTADEESMAMAVLKSLFLSLPTACVFALQQKSLPVCVQNLAENVVKRHAKAIVEDEDPELLSMLVGALVEGGRLHIIEALMDEAPVAVAGLLLRAEPSEALMDIVRDAALADPKPELMELVRKLPFNETAKTVEMHCKGTS
ncbi:hypothetical protein FOL47_004747 [Perkinsus chesapeaki]|uniref:Uncharacterized protein n=1 Tax=Perkinsus chesapeaki TaxID=330153 RepID=A0A7J6MYX8_PERCH|nr:hypothetical protein FOL47_004747 [Perkinsus chesapeaki]